MIKTAYSAFVEGRGYYVGYGIRDGAAAPKFTDSQAEALQRGRTLDGARNDADFVERVCRCKNVKIYRIEYFQRAGEYVERPIY